MRQFYMDDHTNPTRANTPETLWASEGSARLFQPKTDEYICWSRMQAEAGQALDLIIERKERERHASGGTFIWGVGNAPAILIHNLSRLQIPIRTIFSIMKSSPKSVDSTPRSVVVWQSFITRDGVKHLLPPYALVTSRGDSASGPKRVHYALFCHSANPLKICRGGEIFDPQQFRNASHTGAPVGPSQVTALLRRVGPGGQEAPRKTNYEVNLTAWLTGDYWVKLADPMELTSKKLNLLKNAAKISSDNWLSFVADLRHDPYQRVRSKEAVGTLL
jgi:hypothetical protein